MAADAVNIGSLVAELKADTSKYTSSLGDARKSLVDFNASAAKVLGDIQANTNKVNNLNLSGVQAQLSKLGNEFVASARMAKGLENSLKGAFSGGAAEVSKACQQMGTALGVFSDQAVAGAAKALQKFGDYSEANLKRVVDVAAATGKSVEQVAAALGRFDKIGDPKGVIALQRTLGASAKDLERFGAVIDATTGKLDVSTGPRMEAAKNAVKAYADQSAGAAQRMASPTAQLAGQTELLKRELGEGALAMRSQFAPAMLDMVKSMRGMSPEMKGLIGMAVDLGGNAGGLVQVAANARMAGLSFTGLRTGVMAAGTAIMGLSAGFLAVAAPAIALGVGLAAATKILQDQTAATEELVAMEDKRAQGLKRNIDLMGKSVEQLRAMGKSSTDVVEVIKGLQDQAEAARREGSPQAFIDKINKQIQAAQNQKIGLAGIEAPEKAKERQAALEEPSVKQAKAAHDQMVKDTKARLEQELSAIKEQVASGVIPTKKAEVEALNRILQSGELNDKALLADRLKVNDQISGLIKAIRTDEAREAVKASNLAQKQIHSDFENQLVDIEAQRKAKRISYAEELSQLKAINKEKLSASDQRSLTVAIANTEGGIDREGQAARLKTKRDDAKAKAEADKASRLENRDGRKLSEVMEQGIDSRVKDIDGRLAEAHDQQKAGKNVAADIQKLINQRLDENIKKIQIWRDTELSAVDATVEGAKIRAAVVTAAEDKIKAARGEAARDITKEAAEQKKIIDELQKAKDKLSGRAAKSPGEMSGAVMSVSDFALQMGSRFGQQAVDDRITDQHDANNKPRPVAVSPMPAPGPGDAPPRMPGQNVPQLGSKGVPVGGSPEMLADKESRRAAGLSTVDAYRHRFAKSHIEGPALGFGFPGVPDEPVRAIAPGVHREARRGVMPTGGAGSDPSFSRTAVRMPVPVGVALPQPTPTQPVGGAGGDLSQVLAAIASLEKAVAAAVPNITNEIVLPSGQRQQMPVAINKAPNVYPSQPPGRH